MKGARDTRVCIRTNICQATFKMSTITLVNEKNGHCSQRYADKLPSKISGYRRAEHSDLPYLERLIRPATCEIFGDVELERL